MRIVVVSNRLPVVVDQEEAGWRTRPGSGGLVTALQPILRRFGGLWIGWSGDVSTDGDALQSTLDAYSLEVGYELRPVRLTKEEVDGFYRGFSNEIIWPLFHDLQSHCNFVPEYWAYYSAVGKKFADVVLESVRSSDFVWVQDYHLIGLGRRLRERGSRNQIGFFLHIPFPPPDIFLKLPQREDILRSLLYYDIVGFQTPRDQKNFLDCVSELLPDTTRQRKQGVVVVRSGNHEAYIGSFPIGIDYALFAHGAASPEITARVATLRAEMPNQQVILGLDRLDYTKGIPYRLRAFQLALQRHPELHRRVTLLQVVVPSRESVPEYQDLKAQIEQLVTHVNGEFTTPGWVPIHHVFRSLEWEELLSYYRVADVGLVTPLKDGMNLVAKEYCACQEEGNGVLILSEFAGAAVQLRRDAILINPYDLDQVAAAIHRAVLLSPEERKPAMRRLRSIIRRQDVCWWVDRFLGACGITFGEAKLASLAMQRPPRSSLSSRPLPSSVRSATADRTSP